MAFIQDRLVTPLRNNRSAQILAYSALAIAVVYLLFIRTLGNLPDIMGDELAYSMQARHQPLSTSALPNYLYFWVYGSTTACGVGFYACSQALNIVFTLGAGVLLFVIARRFVAQWASILVSLAFVLGPLSSYTSYFMPESMYFFFLALVIWHLTKQVSQTGYWFWVQAGTYIGLLSLVKPHGLLLLPGILTYLVVTQWAPAAGRWLRLIINTGSLIASTVVLKFLIGLILAGPNGLTLFGGYTNTLSNGTASAATSAGTAAGSAASAGASAGGFFGGDSIGFIFGQVGVQLLSVIFVAAVPVIASLGYLIRSKSRVDGNKPLADYSLLILSMLLWMIPTIAAFNNLIRLGGEDSANRIMLRYYEFLLPLFLVTLVGAVAKSQVLSSVWRWVLAIAGSGLVIIASTFILQSVTNTATGATAPRYHLQFVDSSMLKVMLDTPWLAPVVTTLTIIGLLIWASNAQWGGRLWLAALLPVILLLSSFALVQNYSWRSNTTLAADTAGFLVRDSIPGDEFGNLMVIGTSSGNKSELVTKFHLDHPEIQTIEVQDATSYAAPAGDTSIKWELALGNVTLSDPGWVMAKVGGVQLLRRDTGDVQIFGNNSYTGGFIQSQTGLDRPGAQGVCSTLGTVTLTVNKAIQNGNTVRMGLSSYVYSQGQNVTVTVGDKSGTLGLGAAQRPVDVNFPATNSQPTQTVTLTMPPVNYAGLCISYIEVK
jgi:phosphoglycerol transferase